MNRAALLLALIMCAACGSPQAPAKKPQACVVGKFISAMEDDAFGVSVKLSEARTSATGYQSLNETQFYVHDKGNPTRGLKADDEVWLIENATAPPQSSPGQFPFSYLSADQAKAQCPPLP